MNKFTYIFLSLIILLVYNCGGIKEQSTTEKFQGMWKLDKFETFDVEMNSWIVDSTRIGHTGFIIYDGKGHMSVQLLPMGYKNLNTNIDLDTLSIDSLQELTDLYASNYVYFANYKLTDSAVEHTIVSASDPSHCGQTLIRNFEFKNDTLILTPRIAGSENKLRLKWIKV